MPPLRHTIHAIASDRYTSDLSHIAELHGGHFPQRFNRHQPYDARISSHRTDNTHFLAQGDFALPSALLDKIKDTQDAAVNLTTQKKDASRLKEFLAFCEGLGIRPNDALPAREEVLLAWASSYAGHLAGKTVGAKLLAIRKEHERRGLIWYGGNCLRGILKGVEELRPPSSFYSKRVPITIPMLEDLNRGFDRSSGLDICVRAICLLSFFCQLRSGEVLPPTRNLEKFDPHRHATFANIAESTAANGACNLHLPWSKTQKARGDDVWIPRQEAPLDPIHAIHKHFIKNKLSLHHPIAAYRDQHNNIITLTCSKFVRRVNEILRATRKGYPRISGHCFRIGGTTFYLVSRVPPDMVKKFGRWRSQAFLEYWRCLDYLGAIHIDMLPLKPPARPHQTHARSSLDFVCG
jgi:hypothetical protein